MIPDAYQLVEAVMDGQVGRESDNDVAHWWCCDESMAWCGLDISEMEWVDEGDAADCPLCVLAYEDGFCPTCGPCEVGS